MTCPNADLPFGILEGGAIGASDYYGVDPSWFAGAAWSRPVFDSQGQEVSGGNTEISVNTDWVTFDNLELKGHYWSGVYTFGANATILNAGDGILVENCYFHGWTHAPYDGGQTPDSYIVLLSDGTDCVADSCVFDDSDGDSASGTASLYWTEVSQCSLHDLAAGVVSSAVAAGDTAYNVNVSYDSSHAGQLAIQAQYAYGNIVHDVQTASVVVPYNDEYGASSYAWNNVVWNTTAAAPFVVYGSPCTSCNEPSSLFLWNNTLVSTGAIPCVEVLSSGNGNLATIDVRNTHCVSNGAAILTIDPGVTAASIVDAGNLLMTLALATTQGYTEGNAFAPTAASDATVDAGENLTFLCGQTLPVICADALPNCTLTAQSLCTGLDGNPRPDGGNWDLGAYELP